MSQKQRISFINKSIKVLDEEKCAKCEYFNIAGEDTQVIYGSNSVIWPSTKINYVCEHLNMCKYLQKLFASDTTPKVEE